MKMKRTLKRVVAALMLVAGILAVSAPSAADEIVQVFGSKNQLLGTYPATSVGTIAFAEAPDSIEIDLGKGVKFTMIKIEGGVPFTLKNSSGEFTASAWANGKATKRMEDFWIGKVEVTQGIWKAVMGIADDDDLPLSDNGTKQSAFDSSCPMGNVSWNDITEENGFLSKLNDKLDEIKTSNPALAPIIGNKVFRLPNEWEWTYAAAGGKDYDALQYYFSGTTGETSEDLEEVAINRLAPNHAPSVAVVGSKNPNVFGLYDMSGNVMEWCSGFGYPGYENTPGYLTSLGEWESTDCVVKGGSWYQSAAVSFRVVGRNDYPKTTRLNALGFRLAL